MANTTLKLALGGVSVVAIYLWLKNQNCEKNKLENLLPSKKTIEPITNIIPNKINRIENRLNDIRDYRVDKKPRKRLIDGSGIAKEPVLDYNQLNDSRNSIIPPDITPPPFVIDNGQVVGIDGSLNTTNIQSACKCRNRKQKRYLLGLNGLNGLNL